MTPETIVNKILPAKHPTEHIDEQEHFYDVGYNQALSDIRQRLIDTYGKEWVALPTVEELAQIMWNAEKPSLGWDKYKATRQNSMETIYLRRAESILKGLKEKGQ